MAHNLLNELTIWFHFEKARTKCVPEIMDAKVREEQRLTILFDSKLFFLRIVISANALNSSVQTMRIHKFTQSVAENEICVTLDCGARF